MIIELHGAVLPWVEKITLVIEAIGYDNVRINYCSLDNPLVILANEALEMVALESSCTCAGRRGRPITNMSQFVTNDASDFITAKGVEEPRRRTHGGTLRISSGGESIGLWAVP
jgi:hypothetical protein